MLPYKIDAVVLAGGESSPAVMQATGQARRANIKIGEHSMLEHVINALNDSGTIGSIIVIGDVNAPNCVVLEEGRTMIDNLMKGLLKLRSAKGDGDQRFALIATCDIPFLTSESINDFVQRAIEARASLCYPIIPMDLCRTKYGSFKRTSLRVKEGEFTGGNIMLVDIDVMLTQRSMIERSFAARKNLFRIASILGPAFLFRLIVSRLVTPKALNLRLLETAVTNFIGATARAIVTLYAEIGTDIDKFEDVRAAIELSQAQSIINR